MGSAALELCSVRAHFLLLEIQHPLGISVGVYRQSPAYALKIRRSSFQEMPAQCWWTQRFTKLTLRTLAQQQGSKTLQNPGLAPCHLKVPRDMRSNSPHLAQLNTCSYHISGTIRWHSLCWEFLTSQNNFGEVEIIAHGRRSKVLSYCWIWRFIRKKCWSACLLLLTDNIICKKKKFLLLGLGLFTKWALSKALPRDNLFPTLPLLPDT